VLRHKSLSDEIQGKTGGEKKWAKKKEKFEQVSQYVKIKKKSRNMPLLNG